MRKDTAIDRDCHGLQLVDLDTGEKINWVTMFDNDTGEIRRLALDADGGPLWAGDDFVTIMETRRFRVLDENTSVEVCRTGAINTDAFDAIKSIVGR